MTIPEGLREALMRRLGSSDLLSVVALSGGDICRAAYFEAKGNPWAVKWGPSASHQDILEAEMEGLALLESGGAPLPNHREMVSASGYTAIIMEYIPAVAPTSRHWKHFGKVLAELHSHSAPAFGAEKSNYIGSIPQTNSWNTDLLDFLRINRFDPLLEKAASNLDPSTIKEIEDVLAEGNKYLPSELPALIHGDLWSGNLLFAKEEAVYLIDPSAFYGCREQDLAMLDLFGKLKEEFIGSYEHYLPLESGWRDRFSFWKLIPLLVHVILFGQGYEGAIRTELAKLRIL